MSFFFEGNGYFSGSYLTNSTVTSNVITSCAISTSSIDMLNSAGNYQNITNVAMPINPNDAAIKLYVDNLGIRINDFTLTNTTGITISSAITGSFVVTVTNLVLNGPSATFHITKNSPSVCGHVVRHTLAPGLNTLTTLDITWPTFSGPVLNKSNESYDGSYRVKMM